MAIANLERTKQGYEKQFGINHISHFYLTFLLWDLLVKAESSRVINISSAGHGISDLNYDDPNFENSKYTPWGAYGSSKSANALFSLALSEKAKDYNISSFSIHPGNVSGTDLGRHMDEKVTEQWFSIVDDLSKKYDLPVFDVWEKHQKNLEQGASTQLWAASSDEVLQFNGSYLVDCNKAKLGVNVHDNGVDPHVLDMNNAMKLWNLSEELLGIQFL